MRDELFLRGWEFLFNPILIFLVLQHDIVCASYLFLSVLFLFLVCLQDTIVKYWFVSLELRKNTALCQFDCPGLLSFSPLLLVALLVFRQTLHINLQMFTPLFIGFYFLFFDFIHTRVETLAHPLMQASLLQLLDFLLLSFMFLQPLLSSFFHFS